MNLIERRALWAVTKWVIWATLFFYLWHVGFFYLLFVALPALLTHLYEEMVEYGVSTVFRYYAFWWYLAVILLAILFALIYETIYRAKRRDFRIGGEFEGRIIWCRGVRQGFIYDVWDLKNWLSWKWGKKKGRGSLTRGSGRSTGRSNGTEPSPWDIPLGKDLRTHYIVYLRRTILPSIPERWFIPRTTYIKPTLFTISVPNVTVERTHHPEVPGRWDYWVGAVDPKSDVTKPAVLTRKNRTLLKRSGEFIENAIASDSETKKTDYIMGSFDIPQTKDEEGAFDD